MNWFSILKEQRQVARDVQSFKPIQLDKPIKIKKPEKTCYEKLLDYCSEHGQRYDEDKLYYIFENDGSNILVPKDNHHPDELYCYALEEFKKFMETPKEEIEERDYISTKGLEIYIWIEALSEEYKTIYYKIHDVDYDDLIISYAYILENKE